MKVVGRNQAHNAQYILRLTGKQHRRLHQHLFPGDGKEAVAVALCGRRSGEERHLFAIHEVVPIPDSECLIRTPNRVEWSTSAVMPLVEKAMRRSMAILKIHSHPGGYPHFSKIDDASDGMFFPSVYGWVDDDQPHISAIMLPCGRIFGRVAFEDGSFAPLAFVTVCGDEVKFWHQEKQVGTVPTFTQRHMQAFGAGTTTLLRRLSIGVVGVSGTGSPVIQILARLGIGELVLVDPDVVEFKNLNRILGATMEDAKAGGYKVNVLAREIRRIGLETNVAPVASDLLNPHVVKRIAACDIVIGCMDSVDGRDVLNRIAAYYSIPYFDVGVRLDADGQGGVDQICGTVHYLQPDGSSLLSRDVYTSEQLRAAGLKRASPEDYAELRKEGYIMGVDEERPAVISVNTFFASLLINELLARLHPYRDDANSEFASYTFSLTQARFINGYDGEACPVLGKLAGRGDTMPLLGMPALSEMERAA